MREILFRGKLKSGAWVYGDLRQYPSGVKAIRSDEWGRMLEVIPDTVGQYTGLLDRKGVKVFDGDIVRMYSDYLDELVGENCMVKYGAFNCTCCNGVYGWEFVERDIRYYTDYEIIGNIHDNPELMEVYNAAD